MNYQIKKFISGTHNKYPEEIIPADAAQKSLNFLTKDGRIILTGGQSLLGAEGGAGSVSGLWHGVKVDGSKIKFRKINSKIQYWNDTEWKDIITGLNEEDEYSFANYHSLAGAFTFINGKGGFWKVVLATPESPINIYDPLKNFHGKILIDAGRMLLWDRDDNNGKDRTGLYGSHIDPQGINYQTISNENLGVAGGTVYTGTLAFKSSKPTAHAFAVTITASTADGAETFNEHYDGVLTSNLGGIGTIDYATGVYSITFSSTTTSDVLANYQSDNSNEGGITDFTYNPSVRVPGTGFQFPQDEGGDPIMSVRIGQDGAYYSIKQHSVYRLFIDSTDEMGEMTENKVYRKDIGISYWRACTDTPQGIVLMNNAKEKPELTILIRGQLGDSIEPFVLFDHFDFSKYNFSNCVMETYADYILIACKSSPELKNDTLLVCDISKKTVDVMNYQALSLTRDERGVYTGSSMSQTVYLIFDGVWDINQVADNYWIGRGEIYKLEALKKLKRLRLKGRIARNQNVEVYISTDGGDYILVGTISGEADYVDYASQQTIGANLIGESLIGGDKILEAFPYFMEMKIKVDKFRKRNIKLIAKGEGYFDCDFIQDCDILTFGERIPRRFRSKQNVSLDGKRFNQ